MADGCSTCSYCNGSDIREDFAAGHWVCYGCGVVTDGVFCDAPSYRELGHVARAPRFRRQGTTVVVVPKSMPYKRITYFNEKLSQWSLDAPPICEDDEKRIFDWWTEHGEPLKFTVEQWWDPIYSKSIIRAMLAAIDQELVDEGKRPRFVRKYFEKWLTLRKDIANVPSHAKYVDDSDRAKLKAMFKRAERIFEERFKDRAGRHSFLNYNFITRRLLELIDVPYAAADWPPLKTHSKQQFLVVWWKEICSAAGWPYINNDCTLFPSVKFYH